MTDSRLDDFSEMIPSDPPPVPATMLDIAALSTLFYERFGDVVPLGKPDRMYFDGLMNDFGVELNLDEEMKRFVAWSLDKGGIVQYPRSRYRDWLCRARDRRRNEPQDRR